MAGPLQGVRVLEALAEKELQQDALRPRVPQPLAQVLDVRDAPADDRGRSLSARSG